MLVLLYGFMSLAKKKKCEVSKDEERASQGDAQTSMFKNQIHTTWNTTDILATWIFLITHKLQ